MSLLDLVKEMEREAIERRVKEKEMLQKIAFITSPQFAEQAADVLDYKKHSYSFGAYIVLLGRLCNLISAGIPNCLALDLVQTFEPEETLISAWKLANGGND